MVAAGLQEESRVRELVDLVMVDPWGRRDRRGGASTAIKSFLPSILSVWHSTRDASRTDLLNVRALEATLLKRVGATPLPKGLVGVISLRYLKLELEREGKLFSY